MTNGNGTTKKRSSYWLLLLLIPFIATLIPNIYSGPGLPSVGGIPFFYWYQLLWIILTGVLMGIVYWLKAY